MGLPTKRGSAPWLAAGLALLAAQIGWAGEIFPVNHREPITIRVLDGKNGKPLPLAHLVLLGGYDERDLEHRLWQREALTDGDGAARLPGTLVNLPLLRVEVLKRPLCQSGSGAGFFSVERIRRDGLSAPNRCGTVTAEDAPGVFTVYVKVKPKGATQPPPSTCGQN